MGRTLVLAACLLAWLSGVTLAQDNPLTIRFGDEAEEAEFLLVSGRSGNAEIFRHLAGKDPVNLTKNEAADLFPNWSPDGSQIVFSSNRSGAFNLWLMNGDGGALRQLTSAPRGSAACYCPSWSPEGDRIAYQRRDGARSELVLVTLEGDEKTIADDAWDPAWSPRGDKIVFTSLRSGTGWDLYTVEPDGGKLRRIVETGHRFGFVYPSWSPDGKRIAYTSRSDQGGEVYICDMDGSNNKMLTKLGRMVSHSVWSPDGKSIYCLHDRDGKWQWMKVSVDGSSAEPVNELEPEAYLHGGRMAWR